MSLPGGYQELLDLLGPFILIRSPHKDDKEIEFHLTGSSGTTTKEIHAVITTCAACVLEEIGNPELGERIVKAFEDYYREKE